MKMTSQIQTKSWQEHVDGLLAWLQGKQGQQGVAGQSASFVFRPGGTPGNGVYITPASLKAAMALLDPKTVKTVVIDDSIAPCHLTLASSPYNLDNTILFGNAAANETLIIDDGVVFTSTSLTLRNGAILQNNSNTTPWTTTGFTEWLILDPDTNAHSTTAAAVFAVTAPGTGSLVRVGTGAIFGDSVHPVITTAAGQNDIVLIEGTGSVIALNSIAGLGTTTLAYAASTDVNLNQTVAALTRAYNGTSNFVQSSGNTGTGTHTILQPTGTIAQKLSGSVRVFGCCAGSTAAADTITVQLLRDATVIATQTVVTTAGQLNYQTSLSWIDTLPDFANHTYSIKLAGAQNNTVAANQAIITAFEEA